MLFSKTRKNIAKNNTCVLYSKQKDLKDITKRIITYDMGRMEILLHKTLQNRAIHGTLGGKTLC